MFTRVNVLKTKRLRGKWAVRGCCGSNLRLLRREPVESKGSRLEWASRRAPRVPSAAVAVKGLRFAPMNAQKNARP